MKKMNRREFLTLTGAAVVALSLAGCAGEGEEFASVHLFHGGAPFCWSPCFLGDSGFGILCTCSPLHLMLSL